MNEIEKFYRDVLPPTGNYYLAISSPNSKLQQKQFADIESFIAAMMLLKGKDCNLYYATGNFTNSRTIADVQQKKCYYLDIDYGSDNKVYRTAKDAIDGLNEFVKSGDIPSPSYIVSTGHGFHAYWVLEETIPADQWLIGARNLKKFCIDNGLEADHGITGDVARILRAPGSKNVKDPTDPRAVKLFPMTEGVKPRVYGGDLFAEGAGMFPELGKLIGDNDLSAMPIPIVSYSAKNIISNCGIFRKSFTEHGANDTGEIWGNELLILTFTEDGEKLKHRISDGHPEYTPALTDAKWNTKQNCGAAPTTCSFMSGLPGCGSICAVCPVKGSVTSPLHLGKVEQAAPSVIPSVTVPGAPAAVALQLPTGYVQNNDGLWKRTGVDEDGQPTFEPVTPPLLNKKVVDLVVSMNTKYTHHYKLKMFATREFEIVFTGQELMDGSTWDKLLADKRMPLEDPWRKRFRNFIMAWLRELNDSSIKFGQSHFGWAEDHSAFAVGAKIYANGKTEDNDMADPVMQQKYGVAGSFSEWKAKADAVINDRPASAAIIAASLAAPLIGFTRDPGCVLSVHGDSGTGKTTVMKVGQTVWGHPVKSMMSLDDTALSMLNALGVMKNLPAFWDEVRSSSADERLMQTVFRLTAGRERSRLTSAVEQREVHEWQTILITSSNISALGTIASQTKDSDAGIMRIFEVTMPPIVNSLGDLNVTNCYGEAGRIYGEYLANNASAVQKTVEDTETAMRGSLVALEPERFRVSLVSALIAGAELGKSVLGLDFDIEALKKYLQTEFVKLRASSTQHRESYSASALLLQFINEMTPNRLLSDNMKGRGRGIPVTMLSYPKNNGPVYVHLSQTGECLVEKPHFDEWVERKVGLKSHKTKEEMLKVSGITVVQRSLAAGTQMATGRCYCYHVDMCDAGFSGVFDDLYQPMAQISNVKSIQP